MILDKIIILDKLYNSSLYSNVISCHNLIGLAIKLEHFVIRDIIY